MVIDKSLQLPFVVGSNAAMRDAMGVASLAPVSSIISTASAMRSIVDATAIWAWFKCWLKEKSKSSVPKFLMINSTEHHVKPQETYTLACKSYLISQQET